VWTSGQTENVSRTGVLFRGGRRVKVGTALEIHFLLSAGMRPGTVSDLVCDGKVVRTVEPVDPDEVPAVAATIGEYFVRHQSGPVV